MFMAIACFVLGQWMTLLSRVIFSVSFLFYISLTSFPFFRPWSHCSLLVLRRQLYAFVKIDSSFTSGSGSGSVIVPTFFPFFILFSGD